MPEQIIQPNGLNTIIPDGGGPTVGTLISDELGRFDTLMWAVLNQQGADPKKRTAMILNAFSNFRAFMGKVLPSIGTQKID
jgi:hypothetical protein